MAARRANDDIDYAFSAKRRAVPQPLRTYELPKADTIQSSVEPYSLRAQSELLRATTDGVKGSIIIGNSEPGPVALLSPSITQEDAAELGIDPATVTADEYTLLKRPNVLGITATEDASHITSMQTVLTVSIAETLGTIAHTPDRGRLRNGATPPDAGYIYNAINMALRDGCNTRMPLYAYIPKPLGRVIETAVGGQTICAAPLTCRSKGLYQNGLRRVFGTLGVLGIEPADETAVADALSTYRLLPVDILARAVGKGDWLRGILRRFSAGEIPERFAEDFVTNTAWIKELIAGEEWVERNPEASAAYARNPAIKQLAAMALLRMMSRLAANGVAGPNGVNAITTNVDTLMSYIDGYAWRPVGFSDGRCDMFNAVIGRMPLSTQAPENAMRLPNVTAETAMRPSTFETLRQPAERMKLVDSDKGSVAIALAHRAVYTNHSTNGFPDQHHIGYISLKELRGAAAGVLSRPWVVRLIGEGVQPIVLDERTNRYQLNVAPVTLRLSDNPVRTRQMRACDAVALVHSLVMKSITFCGITVDKSSNHGTLVARSGRLTLYAPVNKEMLAVGVQPIYDIPSTADEWDVVAKWAQGHMPVQTRYNPLLHIIPIFKGSIDPCRRPEEGNPRIARFPGLDCQVYRATVVVDEDGDEEPAVRGDGNPQDYEQQILQHMCSVPHKRMAPMVVYNTLRVPTASNSSTAIRGMSVTLFNTV